MATSLLEQSGGSLVAHAILSWTEFDKWAKDGRFRVVIFGVKILDIEKRVYAFMVRCFGPRPPTESTSVK